MKKFFLMFLILLSYHPLSTPAVPSLVVPLLTWIKPSVHHAAVIFIAGVLTTLIPVGMLLSVYKKKLYTHRHLISIADTLTVSPSNPGNHTAYTLHVAGNHNKLTEITYTDRTNKWYTLRSEKDPELPLYSLLAFAPLAQQGIHFNNTFKAGNIEFVFNQENKGFDLNVDLVATPQLSRIPITINVKTQKHSEAYHCILNNQINRVLIPEHFLTELSNAQGVIRTVKAAPSSNQASTEHKIGYFEPASNMLATALTTLKFIEEPSNNPHKMLQ